MRRNNGSLLSEMTATGAGGASFTAGSGEQYASNKGFKKVKKTLKEEIEYTPEKRQEIFKKAEAEYDKAKGEVERYINIFKGFSIDELLENDAKANKIIKAGEAMEKKYTKISDDLDSSAWSYSEEDDRENNKKFGDLASKYSSLQSSVYRIYDTLQDIVNIIEKAKDKITS